MAPSALGGATLKASTAKASVVPKPKPKGRVISITAPKPRAKLEPPPPPAPDPSQSPPKRSLFGILGAIPGAVIQGADYVTGATSRAVATLYGGEDPEDVKATVACSEFSGPLRIRPGEGKLEIVSCWYGHPHNPERRKDCTAEARQRVTAENSLELPTTIRYWGGNPAPEHFGQVLSVTYERKGGCTTPGELLRRQIAREAIAKATERASYEALKQVAGSPALGSWICATPIRLGVPVPGGSVHAIFVSTAELIFWSRDGGVQKASYLTFVGELGVSELQVMERPSDDKKARKVVEKARGQLPGEGAGGKRLHFADCASSAEFAELCFGKAPEKEGSLASMGTTAAAFVAAAHIEGPMSMIALPLLGLEGAAVVGTVGALVVSPLLMAGVWKAQRNNNLRMGIAVVNTLYKDISLGTFEITDQRRMDWGLLRSSCQGLGGKSSGVLGARQLLELNPPSSSDVFQLLAVPKTEELKTEKGEPQLLEAFLEGTIEGSALQSVQRGCVYWIMQDEGDLLIKLVPRSLIPAYMHPAEFELTCSGPSS